MKAYLLFKDNNPRKDPQSTFFKVYSTTFVSVHRVSVQMLPDNSNMVVINWISQMIREQIPDKVPGIDMGDEAGTTRIIE